MQIRDIISEEMESVMSGAKSGQEAADDAASRGNALLREFEASIELSQQVAARPCFRGGPLPFADRVRCKPNRKTFSSRWLPYALLAPQVIITLIFFVWPAKPGAPASPSIGRAMPSACVRPPSSWFQNFQALFNDSNTISIRCRGG